MKHNKSVYILQVLRIICAFFLNLILKLKFMYKGSLSTEQSDCQTEQSMPDYAMLDTNHSFFFELWGCLCFRYNTVP